MEGVGVAEVMCSLTHFSGLGAELGSPEQPQQCLCLRHPLPTAGAGPCSAPSSHGSPCGHNDTGPGFCCRSGQ